MATQPAAGLNRSLTLGIDASRAISAQRTGTEHYSLELIKALATQAPPKLRLRLYTARPPQAGDWPASTQVETRVIPWPRLWTHLRLAVELYQHPPDLLFVPAHVLPLYCPVPALVTVHDLGYRYYPEAHRPFDRWYLEWTTRRHTRVALHLLADSHATKEDLVRFYGADSQRITVVYLGRNETLKRVEDPTAIAAVKAKYGLNGDYLLYLGTLHPRKNLVRLLEAFHLLRQTMAGPSTSEPGREGKTPPKLVIGGKKGWLYDEIFARGQALGLTGQVLFPGYISDEDKAALLSGALAFVFPSLYEGFGLPILEAMACGTPVLTSNVSSLPEVAGEAALLVDPHDVAEMAKGLARLGVDTELRRRLVERGFEQIKRFSWANAAKQVVDIAERSYLWKK
jgi:glycosyltransferase involved in cell wall biosynthesis